MVKNKTSVNEDVQKERKINISESYISLILGILVVLLIIGFAGLFFKNREITKIEPVEQETLSKEIENIKQNETYTVLEGDTLWSIAEAKYNSGFAWVNIAKENKITNPEMLEAGTVLVLKKTSQIIATSTMEEEKQAESASELSKLSEMQKEQSNSISGSSYTIKKGDDLWNIAIRAYGDGYKWVDIAKANNLSNPDLIHSDNVLTIPR